jgi:hypothetical protein
MIHFLNLYDDTSINLSSFNAGGGTFNFSNGQDVIDVTGQARNVLKRVSVRVTPTPPNSAPPYAIMAEDICKHFDTSPTTTTYRDSDGTPITVAPADADTCDLSSQNP